MSEHSREEQNKATFSPQVQGSEKEKDLDRQNLGVNKANSVFQVPAESVILPSKGQVYLPDHPLCNEDSVDIKCMTAEEEDLLTSEALFKNGTVLTKLMESCILNKLVDPDSLLTGDRNAILISLRVTGYGPEYSAKINCPACSEAFKEEFSLNNLPIKPLGATPLQPNTNIFDFTLPRSGATVHFRLLTGADEAEISKIKKQRKKVVKSIDNVVTTRLTKSIVSINGENDRQKIAYAVKNMSAGDSRALRSYIDKIEPGVIMKQSVDCPHCLEESEVTVPLGLDFFWPDTNS